MEYRWSPFLGTVSFSTLAHFSRSTFPPLFIWLKVEKIGNRKFFSTNTIHQCKFLCAVKESIGPALQLHNPTPFSFLLHFLSFDITHLSFLRETLSSLSSLPSAYKSSHKSHVYIYVYIHTHRDRRARDFTTLASTRNSANQKSRMNSF